MTSYRNFIGGDFVLSSAQEKTPNQNPADTRDVLGEVPLSTREEARQAIQTAAAAYDEWRARPAPVRGGIVLRAAQLLSDDREDVARLLSREEGKTLSEARGEIQRSINVLEFNASQARRMNGETVPSELKNNFIYTVRQPLGVVGVITPWNFPVAIPVWKIAPALVAGNTVVFKPATLTPATATRVVEIFAEAGIPKGVLNMVLGSGSTVGDEIVCHPQVSAVSFTGSNGVGMRLYEQGSRRGLRVQCEMGGKNPVIVLEDADLDLAVEATVQGAFGSAGQRCTATSRAVVVNAIADVFVEKLVARTKSLRLGRGDDPETDVGPVVDRNQFDTVLGYLRTGREEGAELVLGGGKADGADFERGYFIEPTIFDGTTPQMRIVKEEIFGPVLCIQRVEDFEEGLRVANDVPYGLTSSLFTQDTSKVFRFVEAIETGITHINSPTTGGEAHVPFGGIKATGIGDREQGSTTLDFYTDLKVVYIDYTGTKRTGNLY
ncbi:MAG: aldehyde dehydrogenase family protein [Acidobacteriota bacterium]